MKRICLSSYLRDGHRKEEERSSSEIRWCDSVRLVVMSLVVGQVHKCVASSSLVDCQNEKTWPTLVLHSSSRKVWILKLDQLKYLLSKNSLNLELDWSVRFDSRLWFGIETDTMYWSISSTYVCVYIAICLVQWWRTKTPNDLSVGSSYSMAAGTHMAASQQAADDQASSLYFSGICQTISVKCQHRNENGLLTCSRNLYVSCKCPSSETNRHVVAVVSFRSTLPSIAVYRSHSWTWKSPSLRNRAINQR